MAEKDAYRSLAERLLVHVTGAEDAPIARARLSLGETPTDLPVGLPLPPDAMIVGGARIPAVQWHGSAPSPDEFRIIVEVAGEPAEAMSATIEAALADGWAELDRESEFGGFASGPGLDRHRMLCRGMRGPSLELTAASAGGKTELRLILRTGGDGFCGHFRGVPMGARALPTLRAPSGVRVRNEGGGGGGGSWTSTAIVDGEIPVEQLASHFAAQLTSAEWRPEASDTQPVAAVSTWSRGDGWTATLAVVAIPAAAELPPRRWLLLRADAGAASDDGDQPLFQ